MDPTLRALNGFGLGARVGERQRLGNPRQWLHAQLQGRAPLLAPPPEATPDAISRAIYAFRTAARAGTGDERQQARQEARRRLTSIAAAESRAALGARVTSDRPFVERLVAFWSNHLCISAGARILVAPFAGSYEREAIRPHVLGRFEDMVLASAKHPAMLVYLDNFQSIGPRSQGAQRANRRQVQRGLNENYARELLELHTLGVDGGYTQQDVQELARMLTGWTVTGLGGNDGLLRRMQRRRGRGRAAALPVEREGIGFAFVDLLHEPGAKTLLGKRYREAGQSEAEEAIRTLARHPSTAKFVATKLVRHFVSDEPPAAAVDRVAAVFRETEGDLREVSAALVDLSEAWDEGARKFRSPQDWLVAVLRALDAPTVPDTVMPILRQLRHPLWSPPSPKGFGDATQDWADPDALLNRAELGRTIARRLGIQRIEPRRLLDVVDVAPDDPVRGFLADTTIPAAERLALLVAGPAFQWR